MIFLSQIFRERSANRDGLYLFSDFCVHFREEDVDDLEQKCLAEIVLVLRSLLLESLIVRYWLKHFLLTNSISFLIVSCGAFKTASSGMVRSVHGTHPLMYNAEKKYSITTPVCLVQLLMYRVQLNESLLTDSIH